MADSIFKNTVEVKSDGKSVPTITNSSITSDQKQQYLEGRIISLLDDKSIFRYVGKKRHDFMVASGCLDQHGKLIEVATMVDRNQYDAIYDQYMRTLNSTNFANTTPKVVSKALTNNDRPSYIEYQIAGTTSMNDALCALPSIQNVRAKGKTISVRQP